MRDGGNAVERIIHEDMSWMSEDDAHKLLISLLTDAPLRGRIPADALDADRRPSFFERVQEIREASWTSIIAADVMKEQLRSR